MKTIIVTLLVIILCTSAFGSKVSDKEKHAKEVEKMEKKLASLKFGPDGKTHPFIVGGPNGETLFIVKYIDGSYKTAPSGIPVAPSPDDITRWLFVQDDGTLGERPAASFEEMLKKRLPKRRTRTEEDLKNLRKEHDIKEYSTIGGIGRKRKINMKDRELNNYYMKQKMRREARDKKVEV